jgi:Integrase core domain/Chromo (CHRromatin Organisation MOdifier) domain
MQNLYYDAEHPSGYGGVARLARAAGTSRLATVEWLRAQRPYTLHKPVRKRYNTRLYKTASIDQQWQGDLVEMIPYAGVNDGNKYILTLIDLFSRHAWAEPLKNKTGEEVAAAFRRVFAQGRQPQRLQTDDGREFDNRIVQHLLNIENIRFFTVKSQFKAAVVERFNRTLKTKMWRYFTQTGNYRWIDVLPDLLTGYNAAVHSSIGIAPINVTAENEHDLWQVQEAKGPQQVTRRDVTTPYQVGDQVRVSVAKGPFAKGYLPNWSEQIYTVVQRLETILQPLQYKLQDYNNEEIKGSFYSAELQAVVPPERYAVEKVVRTRKVNGRTQYFVKWLGYGNEFNSWTDDIGRIA